jgi:hypothetical protein
MADDDILTRFYKTFAGNRDFFVTHTPPFSTDSGGKCKAAWNGFAKYGSKSFPDVPPDCGKDDLVPVTKDLYREHLEGGKGLAVAPVMNIRVNGKDMRNVCCHAAIDIDVTANYTWLVARLYHYGFLFAATRSKSGGLHVYFFFEDYEPAGKVIASLEKIITAFGLYFIYGKDKVEIFPKQASAVPGEKNAACLLLPYYGEARKSDQRMITAEGKTVSLAKAMPVIESMYTTLKELNRTVSALPYGDAPYCMQAILLGGTLQEGGHRNDFLFAAAVFLRKKYKEGFKAELEEMNGCLSAPLEQAETDTIYDSATSKNGDDKYKYEAWSCKKPPLSLFCDKALCAEREYCPYRAKGGYFTGADAWGELSIVQAADPYYIWQVKPPNSPDYKELKIDSVSDLLNQQAVQRYCLRDLRWLPYRVKDSAWADIVNRSLEGNENREIAVPKGTDASEAAVLHNLFIRFLTGKQVQNGKPYMVGVGLVYHGEGYYYFQLEGFTDFLRARNFKYNRINLRERLLAYGCSNGEIRYKTTDGREKALACWKMPEDGELLEMDTFYEAVYDGDAAILQDGKLTMEENENNKRDGKQDDSVKF